MPILVECPACGAKLNAPDSGAGKKVRCPKPGCGALVPVPELLPAEEVVEAAVLPPPPPPPKPVVRAAVVADDDDDDRPRRRSRRDDDDDYDDRPRRRREEDDDYDDDRPRRPRRKRSGTNPGVVVAVVLGLLLVLGGGGYGIYRLVGGGKAKPPSGWKEYTFADAGFKAYFPQEPRKRQGGRAPIGMGDRIGRGTTYEVEFTEAGSDMMLMVEVTPLPPVLPANAAREILEKALEEKLKSPPPDARVSGPRSVRWMGSSGKEIRFEGTGGRRSGKEQVAILRFVVTDTHMVAAMIGMEGSDSLASGTINGFFDNIQLLK